MLALLTLFNWFAYNSVRVRYFLTTSLGEQWLQYQEQGRLLFLFGIGIGEGCNPLLLTAMGITLVLYRAFSFLMQWLSDLLFILLIAFFNHLVNRFFENLFSTQSSISSTIMGGINTKLILNAAQLSSREDSSLNIDERYRALQSITNKVNEAMGLHIFVSVLGMIPWYANSIVIIFMHMTLEEAVTQYTFIFGTLVYLLVAANANQKARTFTFKY
jgi:hypothetical protein